MKAGEANLLKFIHKSPQFIIPIYQRNYTWTHNQCLQLWNDLLRAGNNEHIEAHFIGSIVYIEKALSSVTKQESLLIIDGQQRLTTATLIIAALADYFQKNNIDEILGAFSVRKLQNYYLFNAEEDGERHFKLLLSETDKETLLAILKNTPEPNPQSIRIKENYELFQQLIASNANQLEKICEGLAKLEIVEIALDRQHDNPQLIFESMNSTGLELSQADLIRNYILMDLFPSEQNSLYMQYWRPIEKNFGQAAYTSEFDSFIRHYLTLKTHDIPKQNEVYIAFKDFSKRNDIDVNSLVEDIHRYSIYYCAIAFDAEKNSALKKAFRDLRELKVDVAYPLLLELYHDYMSKILNEQDFLAIIRLIESYVFRRAVCGIPTNSLNKTLASFSRTLDKERYLESTQAIFLNLPSYKRFPQDEEFLRELKIRDLYHIPRKMYFLRLLENYGHKEEAIVENYTVEHILPQNPNLSIFWRNELGANWQEIQQKWLHTLGNLTLTAYNSTYQDASFKEKCHATDKDGELVGFASSPLSLNQGLATFDKWDEPAILARAEKLAQKASKIWTMPHLSTDTLKSYLPNINKNTAHYSIDDHPHLARGKIRELFDTLRAEILSLDSSVTEEFLKLYVAYKAETNFVDIVPQANRLCLSLNMKFHEINDPKKICKDITNLGRWGNGDIEVGISNIEEIPYVMGLIRQSFDRQMDMSQ